MNEVDFSNLVADAGLVSLIVVVMQFVKKVWADLKANSIWIPYLTILVGVGVALGRAGLDGALDQDVTVSLVLALVLDGALAALASMGTYEVTRAGLTQLNLLTPPDGPPN